MLDGEAGKKRGGKLGGESRRFRGGARDILEYSLFKMTIINSKVQRTLNHK